MSRHLYLASVGPAHQRALQGTNTVAAAFAAVWLAQRQGEVDDFIDKTLLTGLQVNQMVTD